MSRSSCISFPSKDPMVIIRQSLVFICEDAANHMSANPHCAAAILQYFIYRTDGKLDQMKEYKTEVEIARKSGQEPPPVPELWVFKTQDELYTEDMMAHFGRNAVVYSLRWLVEETPYLTERNNPRYSWDKTKQYRVNIEALQQALDCLPVNDARFTDKQSKGSPVNDGESSSKPSIPKTSSKQNSKKKDHAAAGGGAPVTSSKKQKDTDLEARRLLLFEVVSKYSFGYHHKNIPDESRGYANRIVKNLLEADRTLTPEDLKAGYEDYNNPTNGMPKPRSRMTSPVTIMHHVGIARHGGAGGQLEQSEDWHWYHAAYALLTGKSESEYPALVAQEPETILGNLRLMCASRADRQRLIDAGFEAHLQELLS